MSVTSVELLFTGRGASEDFTRHRTYREEYEVLTDSLLDNERVVSDAIGIPRLGLVNRQDFQAICTKVSPAQSDETPYRWIVSVEYDSRPDFPQATNPDGTAQDPQTLSENPLLRPAVWKITFNTTSEPAVKWRKISAAGVIDKDLSLVTNSAKLPFDPPLMVDVGRPVIRVTKNIPSVTLDFLLQLENAINDRPWRGLPKWCAKITGPDASYKLENGVTFVELSLDIALKKDTWIPSVLDCGMMVLQDRPQSAGNGGDGTTTVPKWVKVKDPYMHDADSPQPFNGNGQVLRPGADPVYLRGIPEVYQFQNFTALLNF